jgi:hypothetical protein
MKNFLTCRKLYRNRTPLSQNSREPVLMVGEDLHRVEKPEDATLVSSVSMFPGLHAPVLDLDYEAHLEPSSTPGHYHLYLDRLVEHDKYMNLIRALADCGLIEWGFADASIKRGATFVRMPGVRKGEDLPASEQDRG